jgi:ribonuclease HI
MRYDVDGFLIGRNPSPQGGGFTVIDEDHRLIAHHTFYKPNFTNNEAELWAMAAGVFAAAQNDIIRSDSQCIVSWVAGGRCKSRPDLQTLCDTCYHVIHQKNLCIFWIEREQNLAGIYNETRAK